MEPALAQGLFEAVAQRDYQGLYRLYGVHGRNVILSFLSLQNRWSLTPPGPVRAEEKLDEFLQQLSYRDSSSSSPSAMRPGSRRSDEQSYFALLRELAIFLTEEEEGEPSSSNVHQKKKKIEVTVEAERMLRDAATALSDARPPPHFVVYADGSSSTSPPTGPGNERHPAVDHLAAAGPPIFDGSVANATPPPLGGAAAGGASGGAGTILHLACALDVPLALAFMLAMGADARASHTAFRRLMIHEAACNGSIQCLTILLELGKKYGDFHQQQPLLPAHAMAAAAASSSSPDRPSRRELDLPFLPRPMERTDALSSLRLYTKQAGLFGRKFVSEPEKPAMEFISMLRWFRDCVGQIERGEISELDAARKVLERATLTEPSKASLVRSCGFQASEIHIPRTLVRSHGGSSDGHGNTALHWAAFKNEAQCVALLLQYHADPNSRAHPSGWSPLHDAAYSNSRECIALLVDAGAEVDARANSGATPLCFAAQEDAAEAAEILLQRGASMCIRCAGGPARDDGSMQQGGPHSRFSGYTPLHYCAHYNAHRAARVLLAHPTSRAAMEIPDLCDRLPIHVAVARGSSDVLRELLHAGARVETRSRSSSREGSRSGGLRRGVRRSSSIDDDSAGTPTRRRPPTPESPLTPRRRRSSRESSPSVTPVSSPILRSMIPSQPVTSSKPWNCLTQRSIDECRLLISEAERSWTPDRHSLFTPDDRRAVVELLRVGKHLEQNGSGIFIELWPLVLSFCGRGWFEVDDSSSVISEEEDTSYRTNGDDFDDVVDRHVYNNGSNNNNSSRGRAGNHGLSLPNF